MVTLDFIKTIAAGLLHRIQDNENKSVRSVNGTTPDSEGNVAIDIPEGFSGSWNDLTDKPFYVERQNVTHDSVTVGIYNLGYATLPFEFFPGVGESYTIIWDGTTYECSAVTATIDDGEEVIVIGNTTFFGGNENTNIPVGIISRHGSAVVYSSDSGEHTISLIGYELTPHKIPTEYIDRNPIVGVIDSSYYNYRYLNPARGASIAEVRKAAKEGDRDIIIRLDLDNWQGTLQYMGLTTVSTDGSDYASALLFSTIKANNVSINESDETVNGTMQFEYWYAFLEPTEGPPADAFVNCQFAEINLAPGTSKTGYYMRVNEDGLWEAIEGPTNVSELTNDAGYITADEVPATVPVIQSATVGQTIVVKAVDENGKPTEWETSDAIIQLSEEIAEQSWESLGSDHILIEWDGNTEGLVNAFGDYYKVSDNPIPLDAFLSGNPKVYMTLSTGEHMDIPLEPGDQIETTSEQAWKYYNAGILCAFVDGASLNEETIPEKGLYLMRSGNRWIGRMECELITPIPEKYLPGGGSGDWNIHAETDGIQGHLINLSMKFTPSSFLAALKSGIVPNTACVVWTGDPEQGEQYTYCPLLRYDARHYYGMGHGVLLTFHSGWSHAQYFKVEINELEATGEIQVIYHPWEEFDGVD